MKALLLIPLLAGCANMIDPTKMDAAQLEAWAKDKNASAVCVSAKTATGNVTSTYVVLDKGTVASGAVSVDADCKVTIQAGAKP